MDRIRIFVPALFVVLALLFVPACGGDEEPEKPDQGETPEKNAEQPAEPEKPDAPTDSGEWGMNEGSLNKYFALLKELMETSPKKFAEAKGEISAAAQALAGMDYGKKATAVIEKHGLTVEEFSKFSNQLWMTVAAVATEKAMKGAEGMGIEGMGEAAAGLKTALGDVSEADKKFVEEHWDKIEKALE